MPLDSSIALSAKPLQLDNPLDAYNRFAQIQGAQSQNALAQIQISEVRRKISEEQDLNELYRTVSADPTTGMPEQGALLRGLMVRGMGSRVPGVIKQFNEAATAGTDLKTKQQKLISDRLEMSRKLLGDIDPNSPQAAEQYMQWHQANHSDPVIGPVLASRGVTAESASKQIQEALQQPGGIAQLIQRSAIGAEKFAELFKPQITSQSTGDTVRQVSYDPRTRTSSVVPGSEAQVNMSPGQVVATNVALGQLDTSRRRAATDEARLGLAQTEAARKAANGDIDLSPKDRQKREAAYPKATTALAGFEAQADGFISDMEKLSKHPGLAEITGIAAGRIPGITANGRAAQALYDKIVAKGGFSALQDMRNASPTGGALGNVSNQEGRQLTASFAAIDRTQDAKDVRAALEQAIANIRGAKARTREAYDMTYEYRGDGSATPRISQTPRGPDTIESLDAEVRAAGPKLTPEQLKSFNERLGKIVKVVRTGTAPDGRRVTQYSDGSVQYGN